MLIWCLKHVKDILTFATKVSFQQKVSTLYSMILFSFLLGEWTDEIVDNWKHFHG